jgi:hypothetical protein
MKRESVEIEDSGVSRWVPAEWKAGVQTPGIALYSTVGSGRCNEDTPFFSFVCRWENIYAQFHSGNPGAPPGAVVFRA